MTPNIGQGREYHDAGGRSHQKRNAAEMVSDRSHKRRQCERPDASRAAGGADTFRTLTLQPDHQADADGDR